VSGEQPIVGEQMVNNEGSRSALALLVMQLTF